MKTALVLEGGGAKGAYQFGALLALHHAGVTFDVMAGSSVGALNGAIAANQSYSLGFEYWWNLRFYSVLKPKSTTPVAVFFPPFYWLGLKLQPYSLGTILEERESNPGTAEDRAFGALGSFSASLCLTIILFIIGTFRSEILSAAVLFAIFTVFTAFYGGLLILPHALNAIAWAAFDPKPLETLVNGIVKSNPLRSKLYATLSYQAERFDPDDPKTVNVIDPKSRNYAYGPGGPTIYVQRFTSVPYHFPKYIDVNLHPAILPKLLLASAALPHGIFPPFELDGMTYVDGGIADNLPVFPALMDGEVDHLIAICLRPTDENILKQAWQKSDRLQRLAALSSEPPHPDNAQNRPVKHRPPVHLPYLEPEIWPKKITLIAPQESFGNFLTATLNFGQSKARRLVKLGWQDTRRALGERGKTISANIPQNLLPNGVARQRS